MYNYYNPSFPVYSDVFTQRRSYYQNQHLFFSYPYSTQSYYQTPFHQTDQYPLTAFNQYERYNMGLTRPTDSYSQYHPQYIWPYINQIHKYYSKQLDGFASLKTYSTTFPKNYYQNTFYQYNKKPRLNRYLMLKDSNIKNFNSIFNTMSRYPNLSLYPHPSLINMNYLNYQNVSQLPPKIRVIFIPPSASPPQQSCYAAPAMPPFLFNRMSQPFCSLPLPPPLPQISSLPLTPNVQQMVMQKYSNPMAILPFTSNYQSFPPNYSVPPVVSQQPSIMPTSAAQPYQYASQPCAAAPVPPSNNYYPSTCRVCIPAPPSLNIPVAGHCWIQHCSACHHIPGNASNPNVRPDNHGRMTPLLRQPTVAQHVQRGNNTHQHYPHVNTNRIEGPRPNNLPPLPPGAVVISDEIIDITDSSEGHRYSKTAYPRSIQYSTNITQESVPSLNTGIPDLAKSYKTYWDGQAGQMYDRTANSSQTTSSGFSKDSKTSCSTCSSSVSSKKLSENKQKKKPESTINSWSNEHNVDSTRIQIIPSNHRVQESNNNSFRPIPAADALKNIYRLAPNQNDQVRQLLLSYDSSTDKSEENDRKSISTSPGIPSASKKKDITTSSSFDSVANSSAVAVNHIKKITRQPDSFSITTISTANN